MPDARPATFSTANPHALATILEASQTRSIIASRDIFDVSGTKLWARDQPVSQALQRKLLDRQLRHPLESCLYAENGVTPRTLVQSLEALLKQDGALAALLAPWAHPLLHATTHLPLHSVAQLLLTAGQASRPDTYDHAVQAMALAGALVLARGGDTRHLRLAMLCGLLHDLGEMYIAPEYGEADADRALDFQSYQHLVVHPHVGRLLVEQLTNYPIEVARAIGEHHERLDGTGYPHCLQREQVSSLGRLIAVAENALAALRGERAHAARASVALRVVPGEFDLGWVGALTAAAQVQPMLPAALPAAAIQERLAGLDAALQGAQSAVAASMLDAQTAALKDALGLARHLLQRLRTGWNASGLWSAEGVHAQDAAEVEAVEDELRHRLRAIQRAAQLRAGDLPAADAECLRAFCERIAVAA
jgi:HD-GYP domain-containing protein (c-di-GMP phosphodiesterase class II)